MTGSRRRNRCIHIRAEETLLERVERLAAGRATNRSRMVVELIELGLEAGDRDAAALDQVLRQLDAKLEEGAKLALDIARTGEQHDREFRVAIGRQVDRLTRLGVESVMILRRLAQLQSPKLLAEAQAAARDFVRDLTKVPRSADGVAVNGEAGPP